MERRAGRSVSNQSTTEGGGNQQARSTEAPPVRRVIRSSTDLSIFDDNPSKRSRNQQAEDNS